MKAKLFHVMGIFILCILSGVVEVISARFCRIFFVEMDLEIPGGIAGFLIKCTMIYHLPLILSCCSFALFIILLISYRFKIAFIEKLINSYALSWLLFLSVISLGLFLFFPFFTAMNPGIVSMTK
jgi:hypothetical protein